MLYLIISLQKQGRMVERFSVECRGVFEVFPFMAMCDKMQLSGSGAPAVDYNFYKYKEDIPDM